MYNKYNIYIKCTIPKYCNGIRNRTCKPKIVLELEIELVQNKIL